MSGNFDLVACVWVSAETCILNMFHAQLNLQHVLVLKELRSQIYVAEMKCFFDFSLYNVSLNEILVGSKWCNCSVHFFFFFFNPMTIFVVEGRKEGRKTKFFAFVGEADHSRPVWEMLLGRLCPVRSPVRGQPGVPDGGQRPPDPALGDLVFPQPHAPPGLARGQQGRHDIVPRDNLVGPSPRPSPPHARGPSLHGRLGRRSRQPG